LRNGNRCAARCSWPSRNARISRSSTARFRAARTMIAYLGNEPMAGSADPLLADWPKSRDERGVLRSSDSRARPSPCGRSAIRYSARPRLLSACTAMRRGQIGEDWEQIRALSVSETRGVSVLHLNISRAAVGTMRSPAAVTIGIDPYRTSRPEGQWHQPGRARGRLPRRQVNTPFDRRVDRVVGYSACGPQRLSEFQF